MRQEIVVWIAISCTVCLYGISSVAAVPVDVDTIEAWVNIKQHKPDHIRIITGYNAAVNAGYSLLLSNIGQVKTFLHVNGGWQV